MALSLAPLENALQQLEKALAQPRNEFIRDSIIQRFEFTFELSWKMMQKWIEIDRPMKETSIRSILREALAQGFISDIDQWFEFQRYRNMTSHIYSEDVAEMICKKVEGFPPICRDLIEKLKARSES